MKPAAIVGGAILATSFAALAMVQALWWTRPPSPGGTRSESATPGVERVVTVSEASPNGAPPKQPVPGQFQRSQSIPTQILALGPSAMAQAPRQGGPAAIPAYASAAPPFVVQKLPPCENPNAMGVARVVEIDTAGGPGFGFQHFKSYDFLRDHEVVLTFDDGPWPANTPAVLKALADQCVRATFFPIGKHATYHPEILKQVIAAGHTVGSHTWSHADLVAVLAKLGPAAAKEEIEKGASAVHLMAGAPIAPFFRFPDLRHPPEMVSYLGDRNVAIFSTDIDSFDFRIKNPDQLIKSVMGKLTKMGKGIILVHDFQRGTSIALPRLLEQMQKNSFKIVHMVPKSTLTTLPQYDEAVLKQNVLQTATNRPTDSVVKTISE